VDEHLGEVFTTAEAPPEAEQEEVSVSTDIEGKVDHVLHRFSIHNFRVYLAVAQTHGRCSTSGLVQGGGVFVVRESSQ
jgi:hypothetical protein